MKKYQQEQKIKDKDRINREGGLKALKNSHKRTAKPERIKHLEDPLLRFSEEELDFMYYVDGVNLETVRE